MTELCNKCNQNLQESDKTLAGRYFKHCSACREINRIYQTRFDGYSHHSQNQQWKDNMKQFQQTSKYKEYQKLYRRLLQQTCKYQTYHQNYRRLNLLNICDCISDKEYTEKDFEISFI